MSALLFWQLFALILFACIVCGIMSYYILVLFLKKTVEAQRDMLLALDVDDEIEETQPSAQQPILDYSQFPPTGI